MPGNTIKARLVSTIISLGVVALIWYFLRLDPLFTGALAFVVVLGTLLPGAASSLAWGAGLLGLASLAYFYFGSAQTPLAAVLGVVGAGYLVMGIAQTLRRAKGGGPPS